jgi:hypothetical protein
VRERSGLFIKDGNFDGVRVIGKSVVDKDWRKAEPRAADILRNKAEAIDTVACKTGFTFTAGLKSFAATQWARITRARLAIRRCVYFTKIALALYILFCCTNC